MINYQLCKEFTALTPFAIEEKEFVEVIKLYSDLRRLQIRENKNTKKDKKGNINRVIRRPAGDNWF